MTLVERIVKLLAPAAESKGARIVEVAYAGRTLKVSAERTDYSSLTIKECEDLSRGFSALLDVEDLIPGKYFLEVGTPGMDRPLTRPEDFAHFMGRDVKVELKDSPFDGDDRKRFKGKIVSAKDDGIEVEATPDGQTRTIRFGFGDVLKAKLLITDDDIKRILKDNERNKND
jgi:ribosome maturation factor RimP